MSVAACPVTPREGTGTRAIEGLSYGALGLPLAFVALPLYVVLPNHYASAFGVPLAWLGAVLLGARLFDAVADPLIGRWADRLFARSARSAWVAAAGAAVLLALGFRGLFFPAVQGTAALLAWCAALLAVTYLGYSIVSVIHQAWGARLGGDEPQRARIVAWREGLALVGVLMASVLPSVAGLGVSTLVFTALLLAGVAWLWRAPRPEVAAANAQPVPMAIPLATPAFRRLLAIYLVNGIASAVPATLVLFFIRDRLEAPAYEPLFLASYFAAGALSIPLWVRAVQRLGLSRSWLAGMGLAMASFVWAATLGAGPAIVGLVEGVPPEQEPHLVRGELEPLALPGPVRLDQPGLGPLDRMPPQRARSVLVVGIPRPRRQRGQPVSRRHLGGGEQHRRCG